MIINGDALTELRKLPAESVHCCVTSPPYWGLRDYGTAKWEDGDQNCDHIEVRGTTRGGPKSTITGGQDITPHSGHYRDICGKCGAIRIDSQFGLEKTPEEYVARLVEIFREVKRVLRRDGTLFLNLGDSYNSSPHWDKKDYNQGIGGKSIYRGRTGIKELKPKDLVGIPWRVAFALQADGWYLRSDIIWAKPNPMPESVRDRPTRSHEYIFLMSKNARYYFDQEAVREPVKETTTGEASVRTSGNSKTRDKEHWGIPHERIQVVRQYKIIKGANIRSVWTMTTKPMPKIFGHEHFATFPPELPERCIKAGCPIGGTVLDPFFGAGTVGMVAKQLGRDFIGIELNKEYCEMAERRIEGVVYQMEISA